MDHIIQKKYQAYPLVMRARLLAVRDLIFATAGEKGLGDVEETLKWGQCSYWVKGASPIRLDSYHDSVTHYGIYFHCQTHLVSTFEQVYQEHLQFEANRVLILPVDKPLPLVAVKQCIASALTYHKIKKLPLLGLSPWT